MTAPWEYRDPLESVLSAEVSPETLMGHVRTIGAWERESGSPGEALAFDYIERELKSCGIEVERREIEAFISLPLEARLTLPDGATIGGLTHAFSTSVDLTSEVVAVESSAFDASEAVAEATGFSSAGATTGGVFVFGASTISCEATPVRMSHRVRSFRPFRVD